MERNTTYQFSMPSLGADMEEGALLEWKVKAGDRVRRGQVIAVVDTVKAAIDVEVWVDGVITKLLVEPNPSRGLKVGMALALIETDEPTPELPRSPEPQSPHSETAAAPKPLTSGLEPTPTPNPATRSTGQTRVLASPLARRRAAARGVDLALLRHLPVIHATDVDAYVPLQAGSAALDFGGVDRSLMIRRAIGSAMSRSKREIPHYYLKTQVDLTRSLALLRAENEKRPVSERIVPAALFIQTVALAAREVPEMNGLFERDTFVTSDKVHVGVAIALREGGLVAPAVLDCHEKSLPTIMRDLTDLVDRTRAGQIKASEATLATITVTNLGDLGVDEVFGVIYPPQVAIVGIGSIAERPCAVDGRVEARETVTITLSADHRVSDGRRGAEFLLEIKERLEHPEEPA